MENINNTLSREILQALIEKKAIMPDNINNLQGRLAEGKLKDIDWIAAFTEIYEATLPKEHEAK